MPTRRKWIAPIALVTALGCGGDSSVSPDQPGLHFLSSTVSDTIDALVAAPVELQLNDERGLPLGGVAVNVSGPEGVGVTRVLSSLTAPSLPAVTVTTDAAGRARVWVRLGSRVGREWVRAAAGEAIDSLGVDILVGQPARIVAAPGDTAMWVGQSYALRASVLDRRSNPRNDALQFSATGPVSVTPAGIVTASAIGRASVVVSTGALSATAFASVVPQGVLAVLAVAEVAGQTGGIYTIRTDGSGGRWVLRFTSTSVASASAAGTQVGVFGIWPSWCADASRLVFTQSSNLRIVGADGSGLRDVFVGTGSFPVSEEFPPECAKDGWIYFTRGQFGNQRTFWRVRDNGSGLAQVSERRDWGVEAMPTPNPTGDVVAYQTNDATNSPIAFELRFISTVTGVIRKFAINGYSPRWSPKGTRIAYLNNPDRLNLLDGNGTPLGEVGGRVVPLQKGFSWSPDGEWVIGVGTLDGIVPELKMVNVTSGLVLPLVFRGPERQPLDQPSWQPSP
jgi:hypothetical protein